MTTNSTTRFSDRVDFYIKFRPTYPKEILLLLEAEVGLTSTLEIADVGSGTGNLAEIFLQHGNRVFGIEPNTEMREAAEIRLKNYSNFFSCNATAEATGLPSHSVDLITAGQAFHWFDAEKTKIEFTRILRPGGFVILIWNDRRIDTTDFLQAYEKLLLDFGSDYQEVNHRNVSVKKLQQFFGPRGYLEFSLFNSQLFDYAGLEGRLLSSSYAPLPGGKNYEPMLKKLREIFAQFQENGRVSFDYDTRIYFGRMS